MSQTETETQTTSDASAPVVPRLKTRYREEIVPAMMSEFEIANIKIGRAHV